MTLTANDMEYIKEVSTRISAEISERVIEKVLVSHIKGCPHGKAIFASKWAVIGGCVVVALGSGVSTALIVRLMVALA